MENWSVPNLKALVKYMDQECYIDRPSLESLASKAQLHMLIEAGTDQIVAGDTGTDRVTELRKKVFLRSSASNMWTWARGIVSSSVVFLLASLTGLSMACSV